MAVLTGQMSSPSSWGQGLGSPGQRGPANGKLPGVARRSSAHSCSLGALLASPSAVPSSPAGCELPGGGACPVCLLSQYPAQAGDTYGYTHLCLFQEEMVKRRGDSLMTQDGRKRLLHLLPPEPRPHPHFHLGALSTPLTNDEWGLPDPGRTLVPEHQGRRVIGLCRQSLQIAPALSPPASAGSQAGDPCR